VLEIGQTVKVKVLDIDRERQRISLGLKQTQSDPWQQVLEHYHEDDVVEGRVTKVVTFGAFVEILDGVEGLVHISELAAHHVENPREVVSPGDDVRVKILEIDSERRRLSLSVKRVEGQELPIRSLEGTGAGDLDDMPELGLSEDVFADGGAGSTLVTSDDESVAETVSGAADDAVVEIPEGTDDQVSREAAASDGEGETPGSTVDQPEG
jgi:small subunit ribosomal protein S1